MVELKAKVILFGASRAGESFIEYAKRLTNMRFWL